MRRSISAAAVAVAMLFVPLASVAAAPMTEGAIKAKIDAVIVAHPMDFEAIDALVFQYRGAHIQVKTPGVDRTLTAAEAAVIKGERDTALADGALVIASGIPAPQIYITSLPISGGVQFWGTWDFPDWWAGQNTPEDIAGQTFSTDSCTRMQNGRIWTYAVVSGQTYLASTRMAPPNVAWIWNVNDRVSGFENQADRGTTRVEIVRTSACGSGSKNVGAAFDYEANQSGGGLSVGLQLLLFSVSYSNPGLHGHWGTGPIWAFI